MMLSSIENFLYYILPKRSIIVCIPRSISYYYFFFFSDEMEQLKFELRQSKIKEAAESEKCSQALSERHRMEEQLNTQVFKARDYFEKYKTLKKTMELNKVIIENTSCLDCKDQRKENQILKKIIEQRAIIKLEKLKKNINSVSPAPIINKTAQIVKNQNEILEVMKCTQCSFKGKNAIVIKKHLVEFHETENIGTDWEKFYRAHYNIEIVICPFCKEIFQSQIELNRHSKLHESQDTKLENMSKLIKNLIHDGEGNNIELALSKVISENFKQLSEKINKPCDQCSKYKEERDTLKSTKNSAKNERRNQETQTTTEIEESLNQSEESDFQEVLLETSDINQQNYEVDELPLNEHNCLPDVKKKHSSDTKDQVLNKSKRGKQLKIQDNSTNSKSQIESENLSNKKSPEKLNKVKQGYPCQLCGVSFTRKPALKKHIQTIHEGKIPHKCILCGQSFNVKSNMTRHINSVHVTDKHLPFSCMNCKKGFKRSDHLKIHEESCE